MAKLYSLMLFLKSDANTEINIKTLQFAVIGTFIKHRRKAMQIMPFNEEYPQVYANSGIQIKKHAFEI